MADPAHVATDEMIAEIEKKLKKQYSKAAREIQEKLDDHLEAFRKKVEGRLEALHNGEITKQEYENWFRGQVMTGQRWKDLQGQIADDLLNVNAIARSTAEGYKPDVYALNNNYATYDVEHAGLLDTSFTLYDHQTVERIMREEPALLPPPGKLVAKDIAEGKAKRWNLQIFNSVMTQGIIQGESIDKIAKRISSELSTRNYAASVRYARTAMTSAQNAGRYDGYRRARDMGVNLKIEWSATLDQRTRHDHRLLHGQRKEIDEPFEVSGYKILYPAQAGPGTSNIPQETIWNCRCTLIAWVKGFEGDTVKSSPKMGDLTFEEWQQATPMTKEEQDEWIRAGKPSVKDRVYETRTSQGVNGGGGVSAPHQEAARKQVTTTKFVPAKTKEEAEAYAHNLIADHVDYSGMSIDRANEINHVLHDLTQRFPVNRLDEICTFKTKGCASASYSTLKFNPMKLGKTLDNEEVNFLRIKSETDDMIKMYEDRFAGRKIPYAIQERIDSLRRKTPFARWGVQSSYDDHVRVLVTHEYGHLLSDQYFGMLNGERANPHYSSDARLRQMNDRWKDAYDQARQSGDIYKISQYGSTKDTEFFAECFASHVMGEQLPSYIESLLLEVLAGGIM